MLAQFSWVILTALHFLVVILVFLRPSIANILITSLVYRFGRCFRILSVHFSPTINSFKALVALFSSPFWNYWSCIPRCRIAWLKCSTAFCRSPTVVRVICILRLFIICSLNELQSVWLLVRTHGFTQCYRWMVDLQMKIRFDFEIFLFTPYMIQTSRRFGIFTG